MRILAKIGACFLIAMLWAGAHAQPASSDKGVSRSQAQAAINALLKAFDTHKLSILFSGPPVTCNAGSTCSATITPQPVFDANQTMVGCAVGVGPIKIVAGAVHPGARNPKTKIHWTISEPAPVNPPTFTFQGVALIVFQDDDNAMATTYDSETLTDLVITHTYKKKGGQVIYYPLVYQKNTGSVDLTLCGAGDPQIVNN
jgi:hypothetical protein